MNVGTFTATEAPRQIGERTYIKGTVEVTINGKTETLVADQRHENGVLDNTNIRGLAVKYRTGTKVWHGNATLWAKSGRIVLDGGYMGGHTRGMAPLLVGFWSDCAPAAKSQHGLGKKAV